MPDYRNPLGYNPATFNPFGQQAYVRSAGGFNRPSAAPTFNYLSPVSGYQAYSAPAPAAPEGGGVPVQASGGDSAPPQVSRSTDSVGNPLDLILNAISGNLGDAGDYTNTAANTVIDAVTGLPFGIASTLLNPTIVDTPWGTPFNQGGGGIIGAGGALSRRNLERVYGQALAEHAPTGETDANYLQEAYGGGVIPTHAPGATTNFYAPGQIPGVTTPIATHAGFIPGTRVVSGNTDLIAGLPIDPHTGQAVTDATTIDAFAQERIRAEEAIAAQREADRRAAAARSADEARRAAQEAERLRQEEAARIARENAERSRREREAAEAARAEAQRQANIRAANEALRRQQESDRDSGRAHYSGGSAVTDSRGNAVRDSSGRTVTSGGRWTG